MIDTPSIRQAGDGDRGDRAGGCISGDRFNGDRFNGLVCQPYHPFFLPQLTELVNLQIADFPPYWQFTPAQTGEILFAETPVGSSHFEDFLPADYQAETLCLSENDQLLAAAQLLTPTRPRLPGPAAIAPFGQINWIVARPGADPACLGRLLDELAELARAAGCARLGFGRSALGPGWPGVGESWPEISAALRERGFQLTARWLVLSGNTEVPERGSIDRLGPFGVARMASESCGEWRIRAYAKDFPAGECEAWAIPARFAALPRADQWITIEWLTVDPRYRRRGLGRWLFSELLRWQHEQFRDQAVCWVIDDNVTMLALARSLGFKPGPACLEFELEL